jgi:Rab3 GTPase-activating protein regulatory subunit C-terminus
MQTTDTDANQSTTPSTEISDWESIVMEHEQWTTLVRQLEDLMSIQCLLDMKPSPSLLSKPAWEPDVLTISLKQVLEKGRGQFLNLGNLVRS